MDETTAAIFVNEVHENLIKKRAGRARNLIFRRKDAELALPRGNPTADAIHQDDPGDGNHWPINFSRHILEWLVKDCGDLQPEAKHEFFGPA